MSARATARPAPSRREQKPAATLPHVIELFAQKLANLNRALDRQAENAIAARTEMSLLECRVLAHIAARGPIAISDLAAGMFLDGGQTSRLASRLVSLGYIRRERNAEDQRSTLLSLTPAGTEAYARMQRSVLAWNNVLMEQMSSADFEAANRVIDTLTAFVGRKAAKSR